MRRGRQACGARSQSLVAAALVVAATPTAARDGADGRAALGAEAPKLKLANVLLIAGRSDRRGGFDFNAYL